MVERVLPREVTPAVARKLLQPLPTWSYDAVIDDPALWEGLRPRGAEARAADVPRGVHDRRGPRRPRAPGGREGGHLRPRRDDRPARARGGAGGGYRREGGYPRPEPGRHAAAGRAAL